MLAIMNAKTHVASVRLPDDLFARLQRIKQEQAHKKIPNSEFLVEAVKLYVKLAESCGIDDNLMVKEKSGSYAGQKIRLKSRASQKKATG